METLESGQVQMYTGSEKPYDLTYGAWTVKWWQWALSGTSALIDASGELWNENQPSSNVWFLAGNKGSISKIFPNRNIKRIRSGRSILFPVLNCEANSLEYPHLRSNDDLLSHVHHDVNTIVKKEASLNGTPLKAIRIESDPQIFTVTINENNQFSIKNCGTAQAAADGYWIFLKPLELGHYYIKIEGSCESGNLNSGASYRFEIV